MTGGTGAGVPSDASTYPWPPTLLGGGLDVAALPTYTSTGTPVVLPAPTFTDSRGNELVGGAQAAFPAPTPVAGCLYTDAWASEDLPAPGACVAA
jgi:glucan 1,3-beta-glucosidase